MAGNRLVSDRVADLIGGLGRDDGDPDGLNPIGAVIGATVPHEGRRLRTLLPRSIILAPGLGAQGGDAASIHSLRGTRRGDLLVPVSRGLTRIDDRSLTAGDYRELIWRRIAEFKDFCAIVRACRLSPVKQSGAPRPPASAGPMDLHLGTARGAVARPIRTCYGRPIATGAGATQ